MILTSQKQTKTSFLGWLRQISRSLFKPAFTLKGIHMQNALHSASAVSTTMTFADQAVVKNDTSTTSKSKPSIKLDARSKVIVEKPTVALTPIGRLQSMEQTTRNWETTELAASNKRLYSIMTDVYTYYQTMKSDPIKETRAQYANDLEKFIEQRKYMFAPSSHDMTRVVKCVFGADRRRVSAYSIALREALNQKVSTKDLVDFIEQNGGVEQIRLGGTKPLSAKVRAGKVKDEVVGSVLGVIKFDSRLVRADADWADKQVVIVATYLPTGEFQANAVIRHDSAVNAALAAYYSQQQAAAREVAKSEREAEEQRATDLKKSAAKTKAAVRKNTAKPTKQQKQESQAAKVTAEKEQAKRIAANKAHANSLFEEALA
jgi:hypothetical protein